MGDVVVDDEGDVHCGKFSGSDWEINVRAPATDFAVLRGIRDADWNHRQSIPLGRCAGMPVFWAFNADQSVTVLVGLDDESWDAAFTVPVDLVDRLIALAEDPTQG